MTKATDTPPDDFEAVRSIVAALERFSLDDQHRILRWAQEKLGITPAVPVAPAGVGLGAAAAAVAGSAPAGAAAGGAMDIRTFIARKNPSSDNQLTAAIAYYYRFEAPQGARKEVIKSEDLKEAARAIGQGGRFKKPAQTLVNAERVNDGETHLFTSLVSNWL